MQLVFKTDTLNEHLICSLCMGYFRDAMGITECLHTFCRVCILQWVRTSKICPVCEADLGPAPNEKLRPDRVLQTIVDKVFPHFMKEDLLLEHAFWKDLGMEPPYELLPLPKEGEEEEDKKPSATYITPAMRKKAAQESARLKQAQQLKTEATLEKAVPDSSPAPPRARPQIGNDHKTKQQKQEMEEGVLDFKVTQELATRTSDNLLPHLVKPFLRTSTKLTISQLRRYLHLKLACPMDKVTISCGGRELHSELSLHEVNKTYWKKQEPMHIVYQVSGAA